jgi:hypothetical protein
MSDWIKRIRSVKIGADRVEIHAIETMQASDDEREITLRSVETPQPELPAKMAALAHDVRKLLGLPHDWASDSFTVAKVIWSLSEKTGVRGAVISCQVGLECADAPLVLNTPHLPFEQYSETGNGPLMPEATIARLNDLEAEALAFLDGKRAQADLFEALKDNELVRDIREGRAFFSEENGIPTITVFTE